MKTYFDIIPLELKALVHIFVTDDQDIENFLKALISVRNEREYWELVYYHLIGNDSNLILEYSQVYNYVEQYQNLMNTRNNYQEVLKYDEMDSLIFGISRRSFHKENKNHLIIGLIRKVQNQGSNRNKINILVDHYLPIFKFIISNDDLDLKDGDLLDLAISFNMEKLVHLLVENGADVNAMSTRGYSSFPIINSTNNPDIFFYLVKHGAQINDHIKDEYGFNLLHSACFNGKLNIIKYLIGKIDINSKQMDGYTPLIYAISQGLLDVVKLLVSAGANIYLRDNNGEDALSNAKRAGYMDIVEYLESIY